MQDRMRDMKEKVRNWETNIHYIVPCSKAAF
jgi:hypothetical protein